MPPLSLLLRERTKPQSNANEFLGLIEDIVEIPELKTFLALAVVVGYDITKIDDLDQLKDPNELKEAFFDLAHRLLMFSLGKGEEKDAPHSESEKETLEHMSHWPDHVGHKAEELYEKIIPGNSTPETSFENEEECLEALFQVFSDKVNRERLVQWACSKKVIPLTMGGASDTGKAYDKSVNLKPPVKGSYARWNSKTNTTELKDNALFTSIYLSMNKTPQTRSPYVFTLYPIRPID